MLQPYPVPTERALSPRFGWDVAFLSIALRPWNRRRALAGSERAGVRSAEGRRWRHVRTPRSVAGRQSRRRCRQTAGETAPRRSCPRTAPTHEPWLRPSRSKAWSGRAPLTGRLTAPGSSPAAKTTKVAGLFKIPVDGGGEPVRLFTGVAYGPVWSPKGDLIVYSAPRQAPERQVRTRSMACDRTERRYQCRRWQVRLGGAHRFLRSGAGLVYLKGIESKDFWLVDLTTNKSRPAHCTSAIAAT